MSRNEVVGTTLGLGPGGDGCVELPDGTRVFVPGALPGDLVALRVSRGAPVPDSMQLRGPSAERVASDCPVDDSCGGCSLMRLAPEAAAREKLGFVTRALGPDVPVTFSPAPSARGYRRRARLAYVGGRALGYFGRASRQVVSPDSCCIMLPALDAAMRSLRARLLPTLVGRGEISLALGSGGRPVAVVRTERDASPETYAACDALVRDDSFAGVALEGSVRAIFGDPTERTPALDGSELVGTVGGFSQANDAVALDLARAVLDFAEPAGARVLELYAGHGHLSVGLAREAATLEVIEIAKDAASALERNLAARGLVAKVHARDAVELPRGRYDVVVLDPPRTGAKDVLAGIARARPRRIVLVACDVRSMQRDVTRLRELGYVAVAARAFDMFPATPHVETVVLLTPEPSRATLPV